MGRKHHLFVFITIFLFVKTFIGLGMPAPVSIKVGIGAAAKRERTLFLAFEIINQLQLLSFASKIDKQTAALLSLANYFTSFDKFALQVCVSTV